MTVKDNQPTLQADLELLFKHPPGPHQDLRRVQQPSKAHGRLDIRTLGASRDIKGYMNWPGLEQGLYLERRVIRLATGEVSTQRVYGLTRGLRRLLDLLATEAILLEHIEQYGD